MEACWPSGVGPRGRASKHPVLRWLKTVVVSDREKAGLDLVSWGPGRRSRKRLGRDVRLGRALLRRRNQLGGIETGGLRSVPGMGLAGVPCSGQAVPGVEAA
jgi:hypothetical protein